MIVNVSMKQKKKMFPTGSLKCQAKFLADILFFFFFIENVDILCELSAKQTIYMKCQEFVFMKNN